jgi:hypothetical protein
VSKKPRRQPHRPTDQPPPVDPDDFEEELEEEDMPDEPEEPKPVPEPPQEEEPRLVSYAPGYGVGPDGESVELPKEKKEE